MTMTETNQDPQSGNIRQLSPPPMQLVHEEHIPDAVEHARRLFPAPPQMVPPTPQQNPELELELAYRSQWKAGMLGAISVLAQVL